MQLAARAEQFGAFQNRLHLLSDDRKAVNYESWQKITGLGHQETATTLQVSRASTYKKNNIIPVKKETLEKVGRLACAADLIFELLGENIDETRKWIMSPNENFFGASPFEVCMRGDGVNVVKWLLLKLGRIDGATF